MGSLIYGTDPDNISRELSVDRKGNIQTAQSAVAVTPDDNNDLAGGPTKSIYIGAAGNLAVLMQDGSAATFTALAIGVQHYISVKRIKATGTTATSIVALY